MFKLKILSNAKLHGGRAMETTFRCALVTQILAKRPKSICDFKDTKILLKYFIVLCKVTLHNV